MENVERMAQLEAEVAELRAEVAYLRQSRAVAFTSQPPASPLGEIRTDTPRPSRPQIWCYTPPNACAGVNTTLIVNVDYWQAPPSPYAQTFANTGCAGVAPQVQIFDWPA